MEIFTPSTLELLKYATTCHIDGKWDRGGRWYPTDKSGIDYCKGFRPPSRAFPHSYYRACSTINANVYFGFLTPLQAKLVRRLSRLENRWNATESAHEKAALYMAIQEIERDYKKVLEDIKL